MRHHQRPLGHCTSTTRRRGLRARRAIGCLGALTLVACGGPVEAPAEPELPVLGLSVEPTLQIGLLDGDPHYLFQEIAGSLRLPTGEIAVSDAGSQEVSVYSAAGSFLRRWGGRGEGPGEFRGLSRIYSGGDGSVLALDARTGRVSVFDTLGVFSHAVPAEELTGDTLFPLDVWLYGRFWVDGAVDPGQRARVRETLDRLGPPPPGEHRLVRVARDGRLWIREPGVSADGLRTWTVVGPERGPEAVVRLSARFDPQDISSRVVLGRWLGQNDVNFVRQYAFSPLEATSPPPEWYVASNPRTEEGGPTDDDFMDGVRNAIMRLASAQEIYYAGHATYTPFVDSLSWERPEGIGVDIVTANTRGWAGVFTHPGIDRLCGLGYGAAVPPGWPNGGIVCGPSAGATALVED